MATGMNTYKTQLAYAALGSSGSPIKATDLKRVIRIKDYGDLMGAPESLETTDLEDSMTTNTPGIKQTDAIEFTYNYTKDNYTAAKKLDDSEEHVFAVCFNAEFTNNNPDAALKTEGTDGMFYFTGILSVGISGAGVNEVREGTLSISQTSEIYDSLDSFNSAMGWSTKS
jgi:hypothetical protein